MAKPSAGGNRYYGPNWNTIRDEVIESDGGECVICFSSDDLVVHHRIPLVEFDSHEKANQRKNLATLCKRCHTRIESIQDPHTRRGWEHFEQELSADGVEVPKEFIEYLCYKKPKSDAPRATCCSADDCFYPVKSSELRCPKCRNPTDRLSSLYPDESDNSSAETQQYECSYCGDVAEFTSKPLNQHGCRESANGHHHYQKKKSDVGVLCPDCDYSASSDGQLVTHLVESHGSGRIEAKKRVLESPTD